MNLEHEDNFIRDQVNNLTRLPRNVKWNAEKGWKQYKRKHRVWNTQRIIRWISAAAIILFVLIFATNKFIEKGNENILALSTDNIRKKEIQLKDGSKIWLNYNSSVSINIQKSEITLAGEAYFEFSEKNNFSITSPHGKFKARAGIFNLKTRKEEDGALLTVSQGEVSIIWESDTTLNFVVKTGNQAKLVPEIAVINTPIYDNNYLAWKTEILHFYNVPLYSVFDKLKELDDIEIKVSDINIQYCMINSDFNSISTKDVLQQIVIESDFELEHTGNIFLIKGQGCNI